MNLHLDSILSRLSTSEGTAFSIRQQFGLFMLIYSIVLMENNRHFISVQRDTLTRILFLHIGIQQQAFYFCTKKYNNRSLRNFEICSSVGLLFLYYTAKKASKLAWRNWCKLSSLGGRNAWSQCFSPMFLLLTVSFSTSNTVSLLATRVYIYFVLFGSFPFILN